jgi:Kazal-type serine protease inhibitor-like protein
MSSLARALAASCGLLWLAACVPEEIVVAEQEAPPATPPPPMNMPDAGRDTGPSDGPAGNACSRNEECEFDEYCAKNSCNPAAPGACARRPLSCPQEQEPVCGCNGVNYYNDCLRELNGVNLYRRSECPNPRPCGGPFECPDESYCAIVFPPNTSMCPEGARGVCWVLPSECGDERGSDRFRVCGDPDAKCKDLCRALKDEKPLVYTQRCPQ